MGAKTTTIVSSWLVVTAGCSGGGSKDVIDGTTATDWTGTVAVESADTGDTGVTAPGTTTTTSGTVATTDTADTAVGTTTGTTSSYTGTPATTTGSDSGDTGSRAPTRSRRCSTVAPPVSCSRGASSSCPMAPWSGCPTAFVKGGSPMRASCAATFPGRCRWPTAA